MSLKQNIIYLYFKGKHLITSKSQYQYNRGQYLYFADLNLPQAFEVHFSNKDRGESKTQIGSNRLVEIPDEYFWSGALQIYAWVYLHDGTDDGETIYEVRIPLIKRAKPTDEEPLPVQQSAIDKAIAELNNAVDITNENADKTNADKTQVATIKGEVVLLKEEIDSTASAVSQDAQNARESADASEQSAQNSAESERKALDYSDEAKGYAQSALESKNTAIQKAQVANNASAEAKDFRDEAETFKNEAEQAKQNIVNYRDETKGYRDETLTAKNDVQTIKNDVQSLKTQIDKTATDVAINASDAKSSADLSYRSAISADNASLSASQSADEASDFADSASQSANQAEECKNQSATNVTRYPKVVDGYWYVWDASKSEYVNTNIDARGIKGDKGDIGKTGDSGVYIGTDEPTDEDIDVWIDSDGTVDDIVTDVQINGTSIVEDGVANVPIASANSLGLIKVGDGLSISGGILKTFPSDTILNRYGNNTNRPITPFTQHSSVFYGLAKASGDTTQSKSSNEVGQYTEDAKSKISEMLGTERAKKWELIVEGSFDADDTQDFEVVLPDGIYAVKICCYNDNISSNRNVRFWFNDIDHNFFRNNFQTSNLKNVCYSIDENICGMRRCETSIIIKANNQQIANNPFSYVDNEYMFGSDTIKTIKIRALNTLWGTDDTVIIYGLKYK